jgi:hypothetical protein
MTSSNEAEMDVMAPQRKVRRVVTGVVEGSSKVLWDTALDPAVDNEASGTRLTTVWKTDEFPVPLSDLSDKALDPFLWQLAKNNTVLRVVDLEPNEGKDHSSLWAELGQDEPPAEGDASGGFHRTETLDFVVVIEGELTLRLPAEERLLQRGDVVVQIGASHAWENRTSNPVRFIGVRLAANY